MTSDADINARPSTGRSGQRRRLSLVLALMIGLLASLIYCGSCDPVIVGSNTAVVAMDFDGQARLTPPITKCPFIAGIASATSPDNRHLSCSFPPT